MKKRVIGVAVLATMLSAVYTVANPSSVVRTEYTVRSPKVSKPYMIVFISDIHYGCVQERYVPEKALERVSSERPDVVLLGGDIVQYPVTSKSDMQRIFSLLGCLEAKDGVYFVYGNHDAIDGRTFDKPAHMDFYTQDELLSVLTDNGIKVLKDDYVELRDDVRLVGRDNSMQKGVQRKNVADLISPSDIFTVCVDHTPVEQNECSQAGVDLLLSGHTHGGQLFPINIMEELLWHMPAYGRREYGSMSAIVSSGMGVGAYNLRNLHHCEYVVINVIPK